MFKPMERVRFPKPKKTVIKPHKRKAKVKKTRTRKIDLNFTVQIRIDAPTARLLKLTATKNGIEASEQIRRYLAFALVYHKDHKKHSSKLYPWLLYEYKYGLLKTGNLTETEKKQLIEIITAEGLKGVDT